MFDDIAALSPDVAGVSRPAFSAKETEVLRYLENVCVKEGLSVEFDAGQNAVFALPTDQTAEKYVLIGSHVDSVPMGGNFDGLAGVIAGLLCLIRMNRSGSSFPRPLKVIAMRGEESAWFGPCYIASKCLMGSLESTELQANHKGDNRSLESHMSDIGVDVKRVRNRVPLLDPNHLLEYVELHIEQGPLLIAKKLPAAIVSGIRGNFRHKAILCIGEPGHSGAVPRAYRRDPVLAMVDLLSRLDESWLTILQKGDDLVLTSGVVATDPAKHALSRIPDEVSFSLDIRSQSAETLEGMKELLADQIAQIERERKVEFKLDTVNETAPAMMAEAVVKGLTSAMSRLGIEPFVMASGGGHDAAVFANAGVPTAMVFVRNQNGSHNPDEAMEIDDFLIATSIIYEHMMSAET
jgi:N-carbamoyl-L-amino-acid hydrolase